jgi:hypothetical protein
MSRLLLLAALGLGLAAGCASPDDDANQSAASRQSGQAKAMRADSRFQGGASASKSPILPAGSDSRATPTDYASAMAQQQRMRGVR